MLSSNKKKNDEEIKQGNAELQRNFEEEVEK